MAEQKLDNYSPPNADVRGVNRIEFGIRVFRSLQESWNRTLTNPNKDKKKIILVKIGSESKIPTKFGAISLFTMSIIDQSYNKVNI